MRIAVFDFVLTPHSGPGGCDVEVLTALAGDHELTVLAGELDVPDRVAAAIEAVPVRTIHRPSLLAFLLYLLRACVAYGALRLRGRRYDVRHVTDCSFPAGEVCYAHLCHRAYLDDVWPRLERPRGPRGLQSWANHWLRAVIERRLVRTARVVVVPSEGLRRDIARTYPEAAAKTVVIRNTVDLAGVARPVAFRGEELRARMGGDPSHTVLVFVALGHFERKGLPELLAALASERTALAGTRLWVIGGEPGLVASYRARAEALGIGEMVVFAGRTTDVRPYLWSADAFVAPSHYEAFSLALLEAAAAGLPLLVTRLSGSEELLEEGVNGFALDTDVAAMAATLRRFAALPDADRRRMGEAARHSVEAFSPERFAAEWRALYASIG